MDFRVLGPLEVSDGGRAVALGGVKQRSLLAILLQHPNAIVSTDHLLAELWGDAPPASADNSIQVYVSRLRKELGPEPADHAPARLRAAGRRVRARRGQVQAAARRGPVARGAGVVARAAVRRPRLRAVRAGRARSVGRVAARHAGGPHRRRPRRARHADLVGELEALIAEHPLRERLRGQLMLALYRSARQAEALQVYRAARREWAGELGLEPGGELRRLERAILQQDPALDPPAQAPAVGLAAGRAVLDRTPRRCARTGRVAGGAAGARVRRAGERGERDDERTRGPGARASRRARGGVLVAGAGRRSRAARGARGMRADPAAGRAAGGRGPRGRRNRAL